MNSLSNLDSTTIKLPESIEDIEIKSNGLENINFLKRYVALMGNLNLDKLLDYYNAMVLKIMIKLHI